MSTKASEIAVVATDYTMIRQPYCITMAKWDYTVVQKRNITLIISSLQKEVLENINTSQDWKQHGQEAKVPDVHKD